MYFTPFRLDVSIQNALANNTSKVYKRKARFARRKQFARLRCTVYWRWDLHYRPCCKKKKNVFWKQQICRKPSIRHFLLLAPFQTRNGRKRVVKGNRTGSPFLATPSPPFFSLLVGIFACPKLCESLEQATLKLSFHISFKEVRKGF